MRKKTAPRTPKQRETSSRQRGGLIGQGKKREQSAAAGSTLTNHSHRTRLRQNCNNFFVHIPRSLIRESRAQAAD